MKGGGSVPKMTVVLDRELHKEIRHLAVDLGTSFQQVAVKALEEFLARNKGKGAAPRADEPVRIPPGVLSPGEMRAWRGETRRKPRRR